jgi:hypothetical protein
MSSGSAQAAVLRERAEDWVEGPVLAAAYVRHGHATPRLVVSVAIGTLVATPVVALAPSSWSIPMLVVVAAVGWVASWAWRMVADRVTGVPLGRRGTGILVATEHGYAVRTRRGIVATFGPDALVTVAHPNVRVAALTFDHGTARPVRLDVTTELTDDAGRTAQQLAVEALEPRAREQWRRWS